MINLRNNSKGLENGENEYKCQEKKDMAWARLNYLFL